jgi:hypothetical protein
MVSYASDYPQVNQLLEQMGDATPPYIVNDVVGGETLANILRGGPIANSRLLDLAVRAGAVLAAQHAEGNVHGGITTDHVVLTRDGGVRIIDFGMSPTGTIRDDQLALTRIFQAAQYQGAASGATNVDALEPIPDRRTFLAVPLTLTLCAVVIFYLLSHSTIPQRSQSEIHSVPVWSPDGHRILFVKRVAGVNQVFIQSAGSSAPVQLTHSSRSALNPRWTAEGQEIAFQRGNKWWSGPAAPDQQKPQP